MMFGIQVFVIVAHLVGANVDLYDLSTAPKDRRNVFMTQQGCESEMFKLQMQWDNVRKENILGDRLIFKCVPETVH